jgi:GDP-L-fucose synthase
MNKDSRIFVAGHKGLVGSAIVENLKNKGYANIFTYARDRVDLTIEKEVEYMFDEIQPEYVFNAAARAGGIYANDKYRGEFIRENLLIQTNLIHISNKYSVKKFLFLGSSCIYPKYPNFPITEDQLLSGSLEPTNDAYAVAKIAGIKMCQAYHQQYGFNAISLMPTNLYGPNDNFDLERSHVLPALIRRFHEAKESNAPYVECWGDGSSMREFLYVADLAEACYTCMGKYDDPEIINVGTGNDVTIKQLTEIISTIIGYTGEIRWDTSKPNGTPRKVLNVDKIKSLEWKPTISLYEGIQKTYEWYMKNKV